MMTTTTLHNTARAQAGPDTVRPAWMGLLAVGVIALAIELSPVQPSPSLLHVADVISRIGNDLFLTLGILALLVTAIARRDWRQLGVVVGAMLLVTFLVHAQKFGFGELFLRPSGSNGGFPSGHAAAACTLAMLLAVYFPRLSVPAFVVAIAISWSRIPAGGHFPYQVLAGALTGYLVAVFCTARLGRPTALHRVAAAWQTVLILLLPLLGAWYNKYECEDAAVILLAAPLLIALGIGIRIWYRHRLFTRTIPADGAREQRWIMYGANLLICTGAALGMELLWLVPLEMLACLTIFALAEQIYQPDAPARLASDAARPRWLPRLALTRWAWAHELTWLLLIIPMVLKELLF